MIVDDLVLCEASLLLEKKVNLKDVLNISPDKPVVKVDERAVHLPMLDQWIVIKR